MVTKKTTVVIVEDEKMLADMYATKFSMEGFDAKKANDGQTGFDLVKKTKPDIVLLDIIMPKIDGFGVLKLIKEDDVLKDTPVILPYFYNYLAAGSKKVKGYKADAQGTMFLSHTSLA